MSRVNVPGTHVFDAESSRRSYKLNKMFMSLRDPAARERFSADEAAIQSRIRIQLPAYGLK